MATNTNDDADKKALEDILGTTQANPYTGSQQPWSERTGTEPTSHKEGAPAVGEQAAAVAGAPPAQAATAPAFDTSGLPQSPFQGFQPKTAMEGFDWNREQNIQKSAKDAYAYFVNNAPEPPPGQDKAALGEWMQKYVVPGMNALGHNMSNVQGDKFHLQNWQGDFDVDGYRGAGAAGGAAAWQVDDPTAKLSNQAYKPQMQAAQNPALLDALGQKQGGDSTAQEALKKEIDALINGGASPVDQQALLQQLQV